MALVALSPATLRGPGTGGADATAGRLTLKG